MGTEIIQETEIGVIETFAGNGKSRSTGDGKRAVKAGIPLPNHLSVDRENHYLYIAESGSDRIRRVDMDTRLMHNFAGIGETCYSGDYGPCGEAGLYLPLDVLCDSQNNVYVCDSGSNRIRKIDAKTGVITTIIGTGQWGFNGDGPALECNLTYPAAMAIDEQDHLYIADTQAHRIRHYNPETGILTTIGGCWTEEDDERVSPLTAQNLIVLSGDAIGIDFSDDQGWLRPQCSDGLDLDIYLDDGKHALECKFYDVVDIEVDKQGDLYLTDKGTNRIRRIDKQDGSVTTVAGVCRYGFDGDEKLAVKSMLNVPEGAIVDGEGNILIADSMNHRVRRVDRQTGMITTIAGNGDSGYDDKNMGGCGAARFVAKEDAGMLKHGDGRKATEAIVNCPAGLTLDTRGYLYICERNENKIRRVKLA